MPQQHRPCFILGHQSQQRLLLPSKDGRRQPGWGSSRLSPAVAPWPSPDPPPPPPHQELCPSRLLVGKNKTRVLSQQRRRTSHLNSPGGLVPSRLLSHVDSLLADKGLSPCYVVADSGGDSSAVSLLVLSLGTCGHSAAGVLCF